LRAAALPAARSTPATDSAVTANDRRTSAPLRARRSTSATRPR
jgi:hypothetical protein